MPFTDYDALHNLHWRWSFGLSNKPVEHSFTLGGIKQHVVLSTQLPEDTLLWVGKEMAAVMRRQVERTLNDWSATYQEAVTAQHTELEKPLTYDDLKAAVEVIRQASLEKQLDELRSHFADERYYLDFLRSNLTLVNGISCYVITGGIPDGTR